VFPKVLVTGQTGFVGTNLMPYLEEHLPNEYSLCKPKRYDLLDDSQTNEMFEVCSPDIVVHLAAYVGGLGVNPKYPADFFINNMQMGINVLRACNNHKAYCVLVGSVCSYPSQCKSPFTESELWNGEPEISNSAYGVAKRGLYKLLWSYHKQSGLRGTVLLPTNMYGKHDNFDLNTGHVIPAMIRKLHNSTDEVTFWGTGNATREFLYVEDFCRAIQLTIEQRPDHPLPMNVAGGQEISMKDLAHMISTIVGNDQSIKFDVSKPDGQLRRKIDGTLAQRIIGYEPTISLYNGLSETYEWYALHGQKDKT